MDQGERPLLVNGRQGRADGIRYIGVVFDTDAEAAEGLGHLGEIGVLQLRTGHTSRVVALLVGANGPVLLVVHDDHQRSGPILRGGSQFLPVHQELTVAGNGDHATVRVGQRGGHGGGDRVAHGAVACRDH